MSTQATPADVALLRTPELVELFCTLEAPAIAEMHGEYPATLLQLPNWPTTVAWQFLLGNPSFPGSARRSGPSMPKAAAATTRSASPGT